MNVPSLRDELENCLRRDWSWPSPESGFARWIFTSTNQAASWTSSRTHDSLLQELDSQIRFDYSPVLASCGFVAQEAAIPIHIIERWRKGFARLQQREPFPHDRQAFPFHSIELLGLSLAAKHFADDAGKRWLQGVIKRTQTLAAPFDFWSWNLLRIASLSLNENHDELGIGDYWNASDEDSVLLLWLQRVASIRIGVEFDIQQDLVKQATAQLRGVLFSPLPTLRLAGDVGKNALYLWAFDLLNQPPPIILPITSSPPTPSVVSYQVDNLRGQIDYAVITIREDEFKAVLQRLPKNFIYQGANNNYVIHRISLGVGQSYTVAIVRCPEQGGSTGQRVTSDVIADLNPHWIMLVGIAGGVPANEFTLGDVVVGMRLQDFTVQARMEGGTTEYAMRGGPMHREVQDHIALLPALTEELCGWNTLESLKVPQPEVFLDEGNFYGTSEWQSKVRQSLEYHFGETPRKRVSRVTTGSIAASDVLMKDATLLAQWKQSARELLAVEMELAGVYSAAQTKTHTYPIAAVRGISDIIGFKRHHDWTEYACQTAASFAHALIKTRPFEPVAKKSSLFR